jgi:DNA gyrase subunit B
MFSLVESNYVYIARPPLFRVTRKKTSQYIHSEKEMDDYLLRLGLGDLLIRPEGSEHSFDQTRAKDLVDLIVEIEGFISTLERKTISFQEFLKAQTPRYQVILEGKVRYVQSEEELILLKKENQELQRILHEEMLLSIPAEERETTPYLPKALPFVELFDPIRMANLNEKLAAFRLGLEHYTCEEGRPLFTLLEEGSQTVVCRTLHQLIEAVRANGRKGVEVQRYKGLGEMNADQLWDTTMNPATRILVQVTMPDVIAADHMFSMLMGEEVEPRRLFIEQHALFVKNLDI